jgi:hypothetical protein
MTESMCRPQPCAPAAVCGPSRSSAPAPARRPSPIRWTRRRPRGTATGRHGRAGDHRAGEHRLDRVSPHALAVDGTASALGPISSKSRRVLLNPRWYAARPEIRHPFPVSPPAGRPIRRRGRAAQLAGLLAGRVPPGAGTPRSSLLISQGRRRARPRTRSRRRAGHGPPAPPRADLHLRQARRR